ncbi:hypothetical protein Q3G72_029609 [Acer saccharum]|nr:hypothetical protein Q3G72_029609 [Acer saccharum]
MSIIPIISAQEEPAEKIPKFSPFTGSGRRLDGKTSTQPAEPTQVAEPAPASAPMLNSHQPNADNGTNGSKSSNASDQPSRKLVFGSNPKRSLPQTKLQKLLQRAAAVKNQPRWKNQSSKHSLGRNIHFKADFVPTISSLH